MPGRKSRHSLQLFRWGLFFAALAVFALYGPEVDRRLAWLVLAGLWLLWSGVRVLVALARREPLATRQPGAAFEIV